MYSSYKRTKHNEHIFTVEQGAEFHLKLILNAYPMPADDSKDLYKNDHRIQIQHSRTMEWGLDYMRIVTVDRSHAGKYTIVSENIAGKGKIIFQLKVKRKYIIHRKLVGSEDRL